MRKRGERGTAALEFVVLLPLLVTVGLIVLQGAAAMWTMNATSEAARTAARAYSLGYDPGAAANASLPGALVVRNLQLIGPDHGVRITVGVPKVSPLPRFQVTRTVQMP